jgi:hypothetical protein
MPETKHQGIIQITPELLLEWLQFDGGKIIDARVNNWECAGNIELILEHPEMPEVREGDALRIVTSNYITYYNKRGKVTSIKRQSLSAK